MILRQRHGKEKLDIDGRAHHGPALEHGRRPARTRLRPRARMSRDVADPALALELRATLGTARAWLGEWLEEGVEGPATLGAATQGQAARIRPPVSSQPVSSPSVAASRAAPSTPPRTGPRPTLPEVRERLGDCTRCPLSQGRHSIVFGDGNPDADILFIGEGPGAEEDKRGLPRRPRGRPADPDDERGMGIPRRVSSATSSSAGRRRTASRSPTRSPPAARSSTRRSMRSPPR
jgi:hypothetical protein